MSLLTTLTARIAAELQNTIDQGTSRASCRLDASIVMQDGTGTDQADKVFSDRRTLGASASETLDLTNLTDPFGAALTFAKIKAIMITASADNTNNVVVGAAGSNQFLGPLADASDKLIIPPGGAILLTAPKSGWTVTNSSTDNLKIENSAGSTGVTYDIMLIGTS